MIERDRPVNVTVHEALLPAFQQWLDSRGLMLARFPEELQTPDDLEGFLVTPTEETARLFGISGGKA